MAQKLDGKRVIVEGKSSGASVTYGPFSVTETKSAYYFKVKTLTVAGSPRPGGALKSQTAGIGAAQSVRGTISEALITFT